MLCSFTQIWAKSDDENLEILIDEAVKKVLNVMQWNQLDNVQMVYRDGTRSLDKDCDGTFADFVRAVYDEIGGNKWFDRFVEVKFIR